MVIAYALEPELSAQEFKAILMASTLGERRPVNDAQRLERMLRHADIIVTARDGKQLVGIARAVTDFSYCCYLSDLAVDVAYQRRGIGKELIARVHAQAGATSNLILVSAPAAEAYYPRIGMKSVVNGWMIPRSN